MENVITVNDASKILNVHPLTVRRHINKNDKYWFKLPGAKNAKWRIEKSNFDLWIKEISETK